MVRQFRDFRAKTEKGKNQKYYFNWVEQNARSRMTREEFIEVLKDLEDAGEASHKQRKEMWF